MLFVPPTDPKTELDVADSLLSGEIADEPSSGVESGGVSQQLNLGTDLGSTSVEAKEWNCIAAGAFGQFSTTRDKLLKGLPMIQPPIWQVLALSSNSKFLLMRDWRASAVGTKVAHDTHADPAGEVKLSSCCNQHLA